MKFLDAEGFSMIIKNFVARFRAGVNAETSLKNVLNSPFLLDSYRGIHELMNRDLENNATILEIGGAGGVTKILNPNITTSDIRAGLNIDVICSGTDLPFPDNSFDAIMIKDALHHIPDYEKCILEVYRVLRPSGQLSICEPYWSPLGQFIYRVFHPEYFSIRGIDFKSFRGEENQALFYFLMRRRADQRNPLFLKFSLKSQELVNGVAWLASGGATFSTGLNNSFLLTLSRLESKSSLWMRFVALNTVATFQVRK